MKKEIFMMSFIHARNTYSISLQLRSLVNNSKGASVNIPLCLRTRGNARFQLFYVSPCDILVQKRHSALHSKRILCRYYYGPHNICMSTLDN